MSNILHIESLTKSRHFLAESLKILWAHKKVFFAFAAVPILLFVVLAYIEEFYQLHISNSVTFFINVFFDIAWLRYILHAGSTKPLISHWSFDKSTQWVFLKFALYYFLISILYGASIFLLYYLCKLPMEDMTLLLDPQFIRNIIMFLLGTCIVSYFLLPAYLALAAIAINQPINILRIVRESTSYRTNLFLSCLMLALISSFLGIFITYYNNFGISFNPSIDFMITFFVVNICTFFSVGLFFNLFALYYKKYLAHHHGANG